MGSISNLLVAKVLNCIFSFFILAKSGNGSWEEMNRFELESLLANIGTPSGNVFILGDLETGPEIPGTIVKGQMSSVFQLLQGSGKIMHFTIIVPCRNVCLK